MTAIYMRKMLDSSLTPIDAEGSELLAKVKTGEIVSVQVKRPRNVLFHRKYFSLLNFAYEQWQPEGMEFKGQPVGKNLDVFRGWVTAQAGYYDLAMTPDGKIKASPQSISFANMDETAFEDLYSKTIDVILKHVLKNYKDRDELENILEQVVGYI